jgi:hypothetical protein
MKSAKEQFAVATKYATMVGAPLLILSSIYQLTKSKGKGKMEGIAFPVLGLLTGITAFNAVYNLKPKVKVSEPAPTGDKPVPASSEE